VFYSVCSFQSQNSTEPAVVIGDQATNYSETSCNSQVAACFSHEDVDTKTDNTQSLMLSDHSANLDRFKQLGDDKVITKTFKPQHHKSFPCSFFSISKRVASGCSVSFKRMHGNVYKDVLKCLRNKKYLTFTYHKLFFISFFSSYSLNHICI
jgi:hypothetical protein